MFNWFAQWGNITINIARLVFQDSLRAVMMCILFYHHYFFCVNLKMCLSINSFSEGLVVECICTEIGFLGECSFFFFLCFYSA